MLVSVIEDDVSDSLIRDINQNAVSHSVANYFSSLLYLKLFFILNTMSFFFSKQH